jgi:hypothetical protein
MISSSRQIPGLSSASLRNIVSSSTWCIVTLILVATGALAQTGTQESSELNGTVLDPNGSIVQNATVIAKGGARGLENKTTSDQHGHFSFGGLAPGKYSVEASAQGFAMATRTVQLTAAVRRYFNSLTGW